MALLLMTPSGNVRISVNPFRRIGKNEGEYGRRRLETIAKGVKTGNKAKTIGNVSAYAPEALASPATLHQGRT